MTWRTKYRSLLLTPREAVGDILPNHMIYMGGNAATPSVLASALAERASEVSGLEVGHVLLLGTDPFAQAKGEGIISHRSWFVGPADREAVSRGRGHYVPSNLSDIPRLIEDAPLDAALIMVSPPDNHGFMSLGVEVLASQAAVRSAKKVIVQVNPQMPRIHGNSFIHVSQVDRVVEASQPLLTIEVTPPNDTDKQIAEHILTLIPERACLQLGIGGVPDAVVALLPPNHDYGIHTEMLSNGVMNAIESGVVTGRYKNLHTRKAVTTFILGDEKLYSWADDNACLEGHPCDYTNDVYVASENDRLFSINSALSVDLTGQVNADSIGSKIYSGVGGQVDFVRAAMRSKNGCSVIALPSTAKGGTVSRIVPQLLAGAGVVTGRADVDTIVTEFGVAKLRGRSIPERVDSLIAISHPNFRDELANKALEYGLTNNEDCVACVQQGDSP